MKWDRKTLFWAGLGGTLAALGVWMIASRQLDKQFANGGAQLRSQLSTGSTDLRRQLEAGRQELITEVQRQVDAQVPLATERAIRRTLSDYGITPNTATDIRRLAAATDILLTQVTELAS